MISEALKLINLLIPSKERRDCVKMRELLDALSVALEGDWTTKPQS